MSLIHSKEIQGKEVPVSIPVLSAAAGGTFITGEAVDVIRQLVDLTRTVSDLHFISTGTFSLHQLVKGLVKQLTSSAELLISTWAISEDPMRMLADLKYSGKITKLELLLDEKLRQRQGTPFQLVEGIADKIVLKKCHAKIVVIRSEDVSFVINGSMNWTRNPRIESGFVSRTENVIMFYEQFLKEQLQ